MPHPIAMPVPQDFNHPAEQGFRQGVSITLAASVRKTNPGFSFPFTDCKYFA